jgi:FKBP-type peptidyl-prolyl cis-trans isomerase 2
VTGRLVPGMRVRHPGEPDWGLGQVQSVVGDRITVNFEHAGKRLINGAIVQLDEVTRGSDDDAART